MVTDSAAGLLRARGLRPRKGLGQNFLTDPVALARILEAADIGPADLVVEVGAGTGALTRLLAERAGRVLALEMDPKLVELLHQQLADLPNVEILQGDVLQFSTSRLGDQVYKVVGNLPYYITSAILRHFLEKAPRPELMVVTVQREVAARIVAGPGDMSLLAVSVQLYGRPRIAARIPAGAFYPPPQVDSAVLRIEVSQHPSLLHQAGLKESEFFRVVRAGFSQKRKTLRNSLSAGLGLAPAETEGFLNQAGIDPRSRAEKLSLEEWARVVSVIYGPGEG